MKESLKKYKKFSPFFTAVAIFSGMGLMVWFGILPFQRYITEKADGIQEYHATRENQEEQLRKLPELKNQFENIQLEEGVLGILLSDDQVVDFVQTLERLAVEMGVQVTIRSKNSETIEEKKIVKAPVKKTTTAVTDDESADTKNKKKQTLLESIPFHRYLHVEIVVKGKYQAIVTFLHKMETLPLGLDVIGMNMKVRDEEEELIARPDNSGRNPFLIFGGGEVVTPPISDESQAKSIPGILEASFDTVVYLDNK